MALLGSDAEVNRKATAGTFLLGYSYFASDHALAKRVIGVIGPLADAQALSPLNQLWWRARFAYYSWHHGEYDRAARAIEEANDIAGRHGLAGLHSAEPVVNWYAALVALSRGDLSTAEERERHLERLLKPERRMDLWYLNEAKTCLALCKRDTRLSQELAQATLDVAVQTGMTYIEGLGLLMLAHALVQLAKYEDALRTTARARQLMEHTVLRHLTSECLADRSLCRLAAGRRNGVCQAARRRAAEGQGDRLCLLVPLGSDVLPALCAKALSIGLQPDFVQDVIRRFQLAPPEGRPSTGRGR